MNTKQRGNPITLDVLRDNLDALKTKYPSNETLAYPNVSMSQLSVARHYGMVTVNDHTFIYNPADDSLIREDVVKFLKKLISPKTKTKKTEQTQQTLQIL